MRGAAPSHEGDLTDGKEAPCGRTIGNRTHGSSCNSRSNRSSSRNRNRRSSNRSNRRSRYSRRSTPATPAWRTPCRSSSRAAGWTVALVAVILLFIALMFGMFSCSNAFSGVTSLGTSLEGSSPVATTGPTVAVINLSGTIQYDGSACSPEGLKALLDEAEADADIKAVVLRVDSGGGTATAGEEMATYVRDFSKPVVVSSASMNASAAYEISSQADWIFTAKSTAIGSIGTAMQVTDLSGLYEKLGIDIENITSAEGKDSSYGTRALTDEERASYQRMVDQINETFLETVAEGRGMDVEEVRALATGMTFTGIDAVENGLADELGTLEDACAKAAALGDAGDAYDVVTLEDESSALDDLLSWENSSEESDVLEALKELDTDGSIVK